ncbi:hypothetical protein AB0L17_06480 [Streptomyces cellulosae]
MFGRYSPARRGRTRRVRAAVVPTIGAALLVGLLPTQSLALPPDPSVAEKGRETLDLEALDQDKPLSGEAFERDLETLKVDVPADLEQAPAGTATAPAADSGLVSFGSADFGTYVGRGPTYRGNRDNPMESGKKPAYLAYESYKNGGCP